MINILKKANQNQVFPADKNVFFMTIQKVLILIYTKILLKPAPDKGKKKSRLLTLCQHRFLFLHPIKLLFHYSR